MRYRARSAGAAAPVFALLATLGLAACGADRREPPPGPGEPVAGLAEAERARFLLGRALFERLATADEGLGPLYNAERCSSCHDQPAAGGAGGRIRVLKATRFADGRCDRLETLGGDNIQARATDLLVSRGMGPEEVPAVASSTARVTAPSLFGLGLLEAVPAGLLQEWADPSDRDGDGVSGRLPTTPDGRPARFGRKGDAASIADFVDTALRFELGFTTPAHPAEEPRNGVPIPAAADPVPDPEINDQAIGYLVDFVRFLAPPSPESGLSQPANDSVAEGSALFRQIGCTSCHRPELRTANTGSAALAGRVLRPLLGLAGA